MVGNLVRQQLARKISTFKPTFVACPNEIEGEDSTKKQCGCKYWDKKTLHKIFYVPQRECQRPGGLNSAEPHDHFMCVECGYVLNPDEWKQLAKEAYEAAQESESAIIVPDSIKPEDNGDNKEKEKPDAG